RKRAEAMRTPVPMIIGVVCAPVGLVLVFTAVLTPQWREGLVNLGKSTAVKYDGLWESCLELEDSKQCWPVTTIYQRDESVQWCRALMLSSLLVCGMGIIMASVGVRCWMDFPLRNVAGASGVVIILAGSLCITPLALYMSHVQEISPDTHTRYRYGNSLYFGWVGSCVQILGGLSLALSFTKPGAGIYDYRPSHSANKREREREMERWWWVGMRLGGSGGVTRGTKLT
uniref:Claudin 23-like n=1 Tax=Callorhinchus milii TaxID=7868 RepID=A0A4W3JWY5_CALMI